MSEVATHHTGHNSGIHCGTCYEPGSLKARLCTEGARAMYEYWDVHDIPGARSGKLLVALDVSEVPGPDVLEHRGRANKGPGPRGSHTLAQIRGMEPHAAGVAALHSPNTGVVNFAEVNWAIGRELEGLGARVMRGAGVNSIRSGLSTATVAVERICRQARLLCTGLWARSHRTPGRRPCRSARSVPFRGAYLHLRPEARARVRSMTYPVPDPRLPFLGVHLARRHIDDSVSVGPTAMRGALS